MAEEQCFSLGSAFLIIDTLVWRRISEHPGFLIRLRWLVSNTWVYPWQQALQWAMISPPTGLTESLRWCLGKEGHLRGELKNVCLSLLNVVQSDFLHKSPDTPRLFLHLNKNHKTVVHKTLNWWFSGKKFIGWRFSSKRSWSHSDSPDYLCPASPHAVCEWDGLIAGTKAALLASSEFTKGVLMTCLSVLSGGAHRTHIKPPGKNFHWHHGL